MVILQSDNRVLVENTSYSYLVDNYASSASSVFIVSTDGFAVDDFIVIEELGKENAEIFRLSAINTVTGELTLADKDGVADTTNYAHSESSRVYRIAYNQVKFYWTAAAGDITDENPIFDATTQLGTAVDVDATDWYTSYTDEFNDSGFGWFVYYNSESLGESIESNPIPYGGFDGNTVSTVFADFDSLMNNKDLRLISLEEKFSWLNEALSLVQNKLNLNNSEYFVSTSTALDVVAGTQEYILPNDFSDLVSITNTDSTYNKKGLDYLSINKIDAYNGTDTKYYMRNRYIGFAPAPTEDKTYYYTYRKKSNRASGLSDYIDLPDNAFYSLKDFMLYRANMKFTNPIAKEYQESFVANVNLSVETSVKRDANLDSWEPDPTTVV